MPDLCIQPNVSYTMHCIISNLFIYNRSLMADEYCIDHFRMVFYNDTSNMCDSTCESYKYNAASHHFE